MESYAQVIRRSSPFATIRPLQLSSAPIVRPRADSSTASPGPRRRDWRLVKSSQAQNPSRFFPGSPQVVSCWHNGEASQHPSGSLGPTGRGPSKALRHRTGPQASCATHGHAQPGHCPREASRPLPGEEPRGRATVPSPGEPPCARTQERFVMRDVLGRRL